MLEKDLIIQIRKLPPEVQQEVADFVEFLSKKYPQESNETDTKGRKSILENSFRGNWKVRKDLQDSTKWVRELRKSRWNN